ncbi:MAG TPA: multidrug efflux RND transporter permease subunit [Candidatus Caccoplasma intestinavium]|uniref:Multidrug efflux RND transporter permease subunit n=1 Tax=Candidatus Caccoplasma intestinavium TaxID=2840716 RepID=A0A9D1GE84_9BACT|nr:multidrug efflux RND transporter permease subunit [Candidatus Caccoplasma intestinavium]
MFSKFFINRPIFATVLAILMVLAGVVSLEVLPVAQFPDITPPTVQVSAVYPGASAETVARTVGTVIEEQVNGVDGMIYMSSTSSSSGAYTLTVTFEVGTDIDMATVLVQNRVAIAEGNLPEAVVTQGITTRKQSTDIVLLLSLESDSALYSGLYLSNYAQLNFTDALSRLPGVGSVTVFGAGRYSMRVWLDPELMRIRGVTPTDVFSAIQAQNVEVSAGTIGSEPLDSRTDFQFTLTARGLLTTVEDFGNLVVRVLPGGNYLRLRDIARIDLGSQTYDVVSTQNGKPSASIAVYQSPGSNALSVSKQVRAEMEKLAENLPTGVRYEVVLDTTDFVSASIDEVLVTFVETTLLVILVILLFLQNWRAVIIPSLTIPVSLICTFAVMHLFGFSVNMLTLFGLVLAIAIVVDDAIVVVENSTRLLDTGKYSSREAVEQAMGEITGPVVGVVLVLMAVFIPTAFVGGITGELYKQFALTIAAATFFSGFNSLTLTPALCALFLRPSSGKKFIFYRNFNKGYDRLVSVYVSVITRSIRRPIFTTVVFLLLSTAAIVLFLRWPTSFIPDEDQGYFIVSVQLPQASGLQRTEEVTARVGKLLGEYPEVVSCTGINGYSVMEGGELSNAATLFVVLQNWELRKGKGKSAFDIIDDFNVRAQKIEEAVVYAVNPPSISGLGVSGGLALELQDIRNLGTTELENAVDALLMGVRDIPELATVNSSFQGNSPQYFLNVDRDKAKMQGLKIDDIFTTLSLYLGSAYVNDFVDFGRIFQVKIGAQSDSRARIDDVLRLSVRNASGDMVPFSSFVTIEEQQGLATISRYNMYSAAALTAVTAEGYSSQQGIDAVEQLVGRLLGNNFGYEWTGTTYQETQAGTSVSLIFILALFVVWLVLSAQYESWTSPIAVILGLPFAILGAVLGCFLMGLSISVYSQVGIVLLIALSAKNAILIVEFARDYRAQGEPVDQAAIEAGRVRLRPILMTSLAFVLGVMPLLFASGAGAESRIALGTAVVFGMAVNMILGTLFIPHFYCLMQRLEERFTRNKLSQSMSPKKGTAV